MTATSEAEQTLELAQLCYQHKRLGKIIELLKGEVRIRQRRLLDLEEHRQKIATEILERGGRPE